MTWIQFDQQKQTRAILAVAVGAAIFFASLASEITMDHGWIDLIGKPYFVILALGKVAGWVISVLGARELFPKDKAQQ